MFIKSSVGILLSVQKDYKRAQIFIILEWLCYMQNTFYGTHWFTIVSDVTTTGPTSQPHEFSLHPSTLENHPTVLLPSTTRSPEKSLKKQKTKPNKTKQREGCVCVRACVCARAHMLMIPDSEYKFWITSSMTMVHRNVDYLVYELYALSHTLLSWQLCHFKFLIILQAEGSDMLLNTINFAITLSTYHCSLPLLISKIMNYSFTLCFVNVTVLPDSQNRSVHK